MVCGISGVMDVVVMVVVVHGSGGGRSVNVSGVMVL